MSHEPLVKNETLSHGTIECSDLVVTRRFLTEFLGMKIHRPVPEAQYIYKGGPWSVVCVCVEGGDSG
jgi:catechol 2,3-dioxygenase-like lactoylglutathione lyase family enzyme